MSGGADSGAGQGDAAQGADPAAVRALSASFTQAVGRLDQAVDEFSRQAFEVYDGFGLLGACDGAMKKYQTLLATTTDALRTLQSSLTAMSAGLDRQADALAAPHDPAECARTDGGAR